MERQRMAIATRAVHTGERVFEVAVWMSAPPPRAAALRVLGCAYDTEHWLTPEAIEQLIAHLRWAKAMMDNEGAVDPCRLKG